MSEVTSESAYLTWQKPEDDGGAVISHYIVQKKDVASDSWVPVCAASKKLTLMAMYLMEGTQYLFRVAAENQFGKSAFVETTKPIKAVDPLCKYSNVMSNILRFLELVSFLTFFYLFYLKIPLVHPRICIMWM